MDYKRIISDAEKEIAKLLEERQRIDARLSSLKSMVQNCRQLGGISEVITFGQPVVSNLEYLTNLINEPQPDRGITNSIRQVLADTKLPLSAPEIRTELEKSGLDLSNYANAGAVIHNTLFRLAKQGEVQRIVEQDGQTVYALVKKNKAFYGEP